MSCIFGPCSFFRFILDMHYFNLIGSVLWISIRMGGEVPGVFSGCITLLDSLKIL